MLCLQATQLQNQTIQDLARSTMSLLPMRFIRMFCNEKPKSALTNPLNMLILKTESPGELMKFFKSESTILDHQSRCILLRQMVRVPNPQPQIVSAIQSLTACLYKNFKIINNKTFSYFLYEYFKLCKKRMESAKMIEAAAVLDEVELRINKLSAKEAAQILIGVELLQINDRKKHAVKLLLDQLMKAEDYPDLPQHKLLRVLKTCRVTGQTTPIKDICNKVKTQELSVRSLCFLLKTASVFETQLNKTRIAEIIIKKIKQQAKYRIKQLINVIWMMARFNIGDINMFDDAINILKKQLKIKPTQETQTSNLEAALEVDAHKHLTHKINPIDCVQILIALAAKNYMDLQLFETVQANFMSQLPYVQKKTLTSYAYGHTDLCLKAIRAITVDHSLQSKMKVQKIKNYHYSVCSKIFTFISASKKFRWQDLEMVLIFANRLEIGNRNVKRLASSMIFTKVKEYKKFDQSNSQKALSLCQIAKSFMNQEDLKKLREIVAESKPTTV